MRSHDLISRSGVFTGYTGPRLENFNYRWRRMVDTLQLEYMTKSRCLLPYGGIEGRPGGVAKYKRLYVNSPQGF